MTTNLTSILDKLQAELHACASNVYEVIDPIVANTEQERLTTHLQLYATMRFVKETIDELGKMVNKNMPIVAGRAQKIMTQEDIDKMEFAGLSFSPDTKHFISVTKENHSAVLRWLQSHEAGKELVKLNFHPKSFESFITKEFIEKGEEPPKFVGVFKQPILEVRKVRGA